ncbi:MAG: methylase involved in ubiquinone/menaquinone biosynthesis [Gemmatimonadetes bacterium]|nr:methylase involved in ubiquinone/menaquinone biosynthesis [Gemmatimonadota bacterium]
MTAIAELLSLGLCCPRCKGDLLLVDTQEAALRCIACAEQYPIILGIPDLRVFPDPYIGIDEDRAKGRLLAAVGARTWGDLAAHYYEITQDDVPAAQARQFAAGLHAAVPRAAAAIEGWNELDGERVLATDRLLDVGCGTAPFFVAEGPQSAPRVGVDVAFRWLVVARLRLENAGVAAHLVCACAEAIPFRDASFDVYVSQGAIENVRDQTLAIAESRRVLRSRGRIRVASANRTSPAPDPHLGIPFGGLLPARVAAWWARSRGALPPSRRLLTHAALRTLLRSAYDHVALGVPAASPAQQRGLGAVLRMAVATYEFMRRGHPLRRTLTVIGPTLLATGRRKD